MPHQLAYDMYSPQYPQVEDWSCSACSLAWLNRALGIDYATDEYGAIDYIGTPDNINSTYGLMDASGARLAECLRAQGAPAVAGWFSWEDTFYLASSMPLLIGGVSWNHWSGVRTALSEGLALANSAPGWMGVHDLLTLDDWSALGPFAVIAVPLLLRFPPPPPASA